MLKNTVEEPMTLSQRIYAIARSLRYLGDLLRNIVIINLFFLSLSWAQAIYHFDITCLCINSDDTYYLLIYGELSLMTGFILVYFLLKGPNAYKKLKQWNEDYLEESYTVVFDTAIPTGNTTGERVYKLARTIFPELTPGYVSLDAGVIDLIILYFKKKLRKPQEPSISQSLNYKVNSDSLDLALKTPEGYFIVKDFKDKIVTVEQLKGLINILSHKFRKIKIPPRIDIFRVIVVARAYHESFLNRETLEKLMTKDLKANFKIDLIVEEQVGIPCYGLVNFQSLSSSTFLGGGVYPKRSSIDPKSSCI